MSVLAEAESLSSYNGKRSAYLFDSPAQPKRPKSHSLNEQNLSWDSASAVQALENFPENENINWSELARKLNIPLKNGGQVLKDIATKNGIDTNRLEQKIEALSQQPDRVTAKLS